MPELRQDPITKQWVVIAKERAKRPDDFIQKSNYTPSSLVCPFEYGNESMTPPETLALRPDGSPSNSSGWAVRVVPNKFPAFAPENSYEETVADLYLQRKAYGAHEVVVHGPNHDLSLATYPEEQVAEVLKAYKLRYEYHKRQPYGRYIQLVINHGKEAGASLEHSHSQLFALSLIPERPETQLSGAADYFEINKRCAYCDIAKLEIEIGARIVDLSDNFIVFVPYAARLPFETWVMPVRHAPRFEDINDDLRQELAYIFRRTLRRFYIGLNDPPYNMYLHSSPTMYDKQESYHWHMTIIPKLTIPAGFEYGTNMWINVTIPEDSADFLKGISV